MSDRFVVFLCKVVARLPFRVIYAMADLFYVLLYHVVRYRRKIVNQNLMNAFPEKSQDEIREITRKYYRHLSELGLEVIKLHRMTEKEIDERLIVHNLDIYHDYYNQGKSIILLTMHYNNWEWSTSIQRFIKAQYLIVSNSVRRNKKLEEFIIDSRKHFGAESILINHSVRVALDMNQAERPGILILAADQTPPANAQFWTTFLNQETAFFSGPMKIAIKTNQPVIFHQTRKIRRGYYEVFHYKLIENPKDYQPEEILMAYINKIEEIIKTEPEYWLWSHRRWKHKRPENIELHDRY